MRTNSLLDSGEKIYSLMVDLWPICRSITGNGVRETLGRIREFLPKLIIHEVPSGTRCYDWIVPDEWNIRSASITGPDGNLLLSFADNNLHVVSYSIPIDDEVNLETLQKHLYSIPSRPDDIPYITSYYNRNWGFCMAHRQRIALQSGLYHVRIDSDIKPGHLTYGELLLPGTTDTEILLSTYICHPSLANNELSGPCVTAALASWLGTFDHRFSYRIVFLPETIGAICYISRHLSHLKMMTLAGFVLTCLGDDESWSFMPSRDGNSLCDQAARHVLRFVAPQYKEYSFLERGSDERQYCSPGVDLPVASIMRSKYATYPEYHTSADNLDFVSPSGLDASYRAYKCLLLTLELDCFPLAKVLCEPMMSRHGLRPTIGQVGSAESSRVLGNLMAYSDGKKSLLQIADLIGYPVWELRKFADQLVKLDLLKLNSFPNV